MEYTKGEWKANKLSIIADYRGLKCEVAKVTPFFPEISEANAHLIAAAVNGCVSTNPDNPMAVAESIKEMYEALKEIKLVWPGLDPDIKFPHLQEVIEKALAKAEGR